MMVASPDKVFAKNRAAVRLAMCGDDGEDAPNETVRARTRLISLPDLSLSLSEPGRLDPAKYFRSVSHDDLAQPNPLVFLGQWEFGGGRAGAGAEGSLSR